MSVQRHNSVEGKDIMSGRPWQNKGVFSDFESADKLRNKILKSENFEVKVRRLASDKFIVKERKKISPKAKSKKGKKKQ